MDVFCHFRDFIPALWATKKGLFLADWLETRYNLGLAQTLLTDRTKIVLTLQFDDAKHPASLSYPELPLATDLEKLLWT